MRPSVHPVPRIERRSGRTLMRQLRRRRAPRHDRPPSGCASRTGRPSRSREALVGAPCDVPPTLIDGDTAEVACVVTNPDGSEGVWSFAVASVSHVAIAPSYVETRPAPLSRDTCRETPPDGQFPELHAKRHRAEHGDRLSRRRRTDIAFQSLRQRSTSWSTSSAGSPPTAHLAGLTPGVPHGQPTHGRRTVCRNRGSDYHVASSYSATDDLARTRSTLLDLQRLRGYGPYRRGTDPLNRRDSDCHSGSWAADGHHIRQSQSRCATAQDGHRVRDVRDPR
jgi:hypothetical protein